VIQLSGGAGGIIAAAVEISAAPIRFWVQECKSRVKESLRESLTAGTDRDGTDVNRRESARTVTGAVERVQKRP